MAKEITTQNIKGGTCPYCGNNFKAKYGKNTMFSTVLMEMVVDTGAGQSIMKMRVCREHNLTDEDLQWIFDCHQEHYRVEASQAGRDQEKIKKWKLKGK